MFTLLIIFIIVYCVYAATKKDKHDPKADSIEIAKLPPFTIHAKEMGTFSKFINLAYDDSQLLRQFSFANGRITITMCDGTVMSAPLSETGVEFEQMRNGPICYTVYANGKKLAFYYTTNITNEEWNAINHVLCLAGETRGKSIFGKASKYMGYTNGALKAINFIITH